ncbi:hypothetical protein H7F15_18465 [Pontibacter sp. Tf4]|uniref:hypothetical protein n=1 Tax=Pontibacter sp. Tf4 TaxID=2761620 RepID=UPI00162645EB|nr:hypothetical protein [Pontibacter sp. Tf4]MBB6613031.1 hypothetical protein [Pontibacter sp. Tf4]
MLLYQNSLITLTFDPANDVLDVAYPDLHDYLIPEIKNSINIILETIVNYNIKKMLLDASNTVVSIGHEESHEISMYLAKGLVRTCLQKVARVQSPNTVLEERSDKTIQVIENTLQLPFELQNFTTKEEALLWLISA